MIVFFIEYLPKNTFGPGEKVVALTADVCYALEKMGHPYEIPEDYTYPVRLSPEVFKWEVSRWGQRWCKGFVETLLQNLEARYYWGDFVSKYLARNDVDKIIYWGKNTRRLVGELKKRPEVIVHKEGHVDKGIHQILFRIRK